VTFDNIDVTAQGSLARAVNIRDGASHCTIRNASLTAPGYAIAATCGVYVSGGGNSYTTLQNLTTTGTLYAIRLSGTSCFRIRHAKFPESP